MSYVKSDLFTCHLFMIVKPSSTKQTEIQGYNVTSVNGHLAIMFVWFVITFLRNLNYGTLFINFHYFREWDTLT